MNRERMVSPLLAAAVAAAVLLPPVLAQPLPFISVQGDRFVDGATCKEFVFSGAHVYQLLEGAAGVSSMRPDEAFGLAKAQGMNVMRIFAFGNGKDLTLQSAPGRYNEQAFRALDSVVAQAAASGVRLVMAPSTNWEYHEGKLQYVEWANRSDPMDFYRSPEVVQLYKNHVRTLINRNNTILGRAYRDEPAILAWDLLNEPASGCNVNLRNESSCSLRAVADIQRWIDDMASWWKTQDPNHMLTVGEEGYFGAGSVYNQAFNPNHDGTRWPLMTGQNYTANHQSPSIDYASFHMWPDNWKTNTSFCNTTRIPGLNPACGTQFVSNWVESHVRAASGKPAVLEEFSKNLDGKQSEAEVRTAYFQQVYSLYNESIFSGGSLKGVMFFGLRLDSKKTLALNVYPGTLTWATQVEPSFAATQQFLAAQEPLPNCIPGQLRAMSIYSTPLNQLTGRRLKHSPKNFATPGAYLEATEPGALLKQIQGPSLGHCAASCDFTSGCRAFSFSELLTEAENCKLHGWDPELGMRFQWSTTGFQSFWDLSLVKLPRVAAGHGP